MAPVFSKLLKEGEAPPPSKKMRRTPKSSTAKETEGVSSSTRPKRAAAATATAKIHDVSDIFNSSMSSIGSEYDDDHAFVEDSPKRKTPTKRNDRGLKAPTPKKIPTRNQQKKTAESNSDNAGTSRIEEDTQYLEPSDDESEPDAEPMDSSKIDDDAANRDKPDLNDPEVQRMAKRIKEHAEANNERAKSLYNTYATVVLFEKTFLKESKERNDDKLDVGGIVNYLKKNFAVEYESSGGEKNWDDDGGENSVRGDESDDDENGDEGDEEEEMEKEADLVDDVPYDVQIVNELGDDFVRSEEAHKTRFARLKKEYRLRMEKHVNKTHNSVLVCNGLTANTLRESFLRVSYWIRYVATQKSMNIGDFNHHRIAGFFEYLSTRKTRSGTVGRRGKPLESSSIYGIITGTFIALKAMDYLTYCKKFDDCVDPEQRQKLKRGLDMNRAPEPVFRLPILPIDVVDFANRMELKTEKDVQAVTYCLMRSTTFKRKSSILQVDACRSPGIRLRDLTFFLEDEPEITDPTATTESNGGKKKKILSMKVNIMFEKHKRKSKVANYKGETCYVPGINNRACPVKMAFLLCLYSNAFVDNCETMFKEQDVKRKDRFKIRDDRADWHLFRQTDKRGRLTAVPLKDDETIMRQFAVTMKLPLLGTSGHGMRIGSACVLANEALRCQAEGKASVSIMAVMKMTGAWDAGGYGYYTKWVWSDRINLTKATVGLGEILVASTDFVENRPVAYAPTKDSDYFTEDFPAVIAAAHMDEDLIKQKRKWNDATEKLKAVKDKLNMVDGELRVKTNKEVRERLTKSANPEDRASWAEYEKARADNLVERHKHAAKLRTLRTYYASWANQMRLEENLAAKENRRPYEVTISVLDLEKAGPAVEKYMAETLGYHYGPFEKPRSENEFKCFVAGCKQWDVSFGNDAPLFLRHLYMEHGIVPFAANASSPEPKGHLYCRSIPADRASFKRLYHLLQHYEVKHHEWLQAKCKACGRKFVSVGRGGSNGSHGRKCGYGKVALVETGFTDFKKFTSPITLDRNGLLKFGHWRVQYKKSNCDRCVGLQAITDTNTCVAESKLVDHILAGAVRSAKSCRLVLGVGCSHPLPPFSSSQEENCDTPEMWAAVELCGTFFAAVDVRTMKLPDFKRLFAAKCPCLAERFDEWSKSMKVGDDEQDCAGNENNDTMPPTGQDRLADSTDAHPLSFNFGGAGGAGSFREAGNTDGGLGFFGLVNYASSDDEDGDGDGKGNRCNM